MKTPMAAYRADLDASRARMNNMTPLERARLEDRGRTMMGTPNYRAACHAYEVHRNNPATILPRLNPKGYMPKLNKSESEEWVDDFHATFHGQRETVTA